ncbi:MAG: helix-turn-helix domain-containing protein [Saprospiraceae bacterium]|nr:helix-turn-helix domain-containing protein [Saprospiraceae bacterium]
MSQKSQNNKIILGLKVRQLRTGQKLSFATLSEQTGMSVSYLNEIEKGKKYPKEDKIQSLASALGTTTHALMSSEMPQSLSAVEDLLQSNFLNELPLDLFGIEMNKVVEIIANAPMRVGAFISTLVELSRNYALREENFYFGALRSYLELNNNYFEDLEEAVRQFVKQNKVPTGHSLPAHFLGSLLEKKFGYKIIENGLDAYPELKNIRSVFIPKTKQLLLNSSLNEQQRAFQYGKELGFNALGLKERAYTASLQRVKTFDEALNHFKAGYFSAALLMYREAFVRDMETFLKMEKWDNGVFLMQLMHKYQATPEMLFQRMTNVLPHFFGLKKLFFLRFIHRLDTNEFDINKELHLDRRHQPHGNGLDEHYCRRWVSISLLQDLKKLQAQTRSIDNVPLKTETLIGIQKSHYFQTNDEYLCITIAKSADVRNISVTLGILIDSDSRQKIKYLSDQNISSKEVSTTCERCSVKSCEERMIEPVYVIQKQQRAKINETLKKLFDNRPPQ